MNKLLKISIVAFSTLFIVSSCEDLLDQPVPGKFSEEEFYKTDEDATLATTAVYDQLSNIYNRVWASMYLLKMMPSDETNAAGADANDQVGYQNLDDFKHDSENPFVRDVWNITYNAINRANKVINKIEPTNEYRQRLIAENKALRAFFYMELVSLWGDVPLVLEDIPASDLGSIGRTPKAEVYTQIEKDLTEAMAVLPLKSEYGNTDKFRMSKGTAQALLGKAHLYQEEWSDAVTHFEAVITSQEYGLEPNIARVFSRAGEFGIESLLEINYTSSEQYSWGNFPWGGPNESNIIVQLMGPREIIYTKAPGDSLLEGWGYNTPTKKIYDAFVAAGDESRRKLVLMSLEELEAAGGGFSEPNRYEFEGYFQRKYATFETETGGPDGPLNYGTNFKLLRYADVLLMAAEAHFRDNNENKAREYLNDVRQRPGTNLPEVTATGDALFEAIVLERQLELAFEGFRYIDLVRWGLADEELGPLGFVSGKHEVFPIPNADVISAGLEQNPNF